MSLVTDPVAMLRQGQGRVDREWIVVVCDAHLFHKKYLLPMLFHKKHKVYARLLYFIRNRKSNPILFIRNRKFKPILFRIFACSNLYYCFVLSFCPSVTAGSRFPNKNNYPGYGCQRKKKYNSTKKIYNSAKKI